MIQRIQKKKILIVDDNVELVETVKDALEETSVYEVKGITRSSEAISAARSYEPDMIILDIMMPDLSGNELADELHELMENEWMKHVPIAYFSVIVCKDDVKSIGGMIGGHRVIPKPCSVDDLIKTIEETIKAGK